jgi:ribosomal protein S18 acetylase RimI-like enzyme
MDELMEPPLLIIAPAVPGDAEWCAALMAASEPWITLGRDLAGSRDALARPGTDLFVARDRGERAGFVLVAPYGFAASPYLASIAVAAERRGRGVGAELLRFVERHFGARGHLFLLVSSFNDAAQRLYHRHGYNRVGELPDYVVVGASEIILHKRLT